MPMQAFVRKSVGTNGAISGQSILPNLIPVRKLHELCTFKLPGPLITGPVTFSGAAALSKVNLTDELHSDWAGSIAKLNGMVFKASCTTPPLDIAKHYGLSTDQTTGLALAILQTGVKLRTDLGAPPVLALMVNLLQTVSPDSKALGKFNAFSGALVRQVLPGSPQLLNWFELASTERENALHKIFAQALALAKSLGLGPGPGKSISFEAISASPFKRPDVQYAIPSVNRGSEAVCTIAGLSNELMMSAADFTTRYRDVDDAQDTAVALILPFLIHGMFQASQYHRSLGILKGEQQHPTVPEWAHATRTALSIATEAQLTDHCSPDSIQDADIVVPFLPHRIEALAISQAVTKAMIESPAVPARFKPALKRELATNHDRLSGNILVPTHESGEPWDAAGKLRTRKISQGNPAPSE